MHTGMPTLVLVFVEPMGPLPLTPCTCGAIPYYKGGLFGMYRLSTDSRNIMAPTVSLDTLTGKSVLPTQKELDKYRVFSPVMVSHVEHILLFYGQLLAHQSDRDIYRTYFPDQCS